MLCCYRPIVITACHPVLCPLYLEPTLTLHNIFSVCEGVTGWSGLDVPESKRYDIDRRYQTVSQKVEAVLKEWRAHHPAPSWKGLARALYKTGEVRALRRLYGKYLTGTCMSCDLTCNGLFVVVTFITVCCMCNGNCVQMVWFGACTCVRVSFLVA